MRVRRPRRRLCPTRSSSSTAAFVLPRCNTAPSPIGSLTLPPLAHPCVFVARVRPKAALLSPAAFFRHPAQSLARCAAQIFRRFTNPTPHLTPTRPLPYHALHAPLAPHHNALLYRRQPCVHPSALTPPHLLLPLLPLHRHHRHPPIMHPLNTTAATDAATCAPPASHRLPSSTTPLYGSTPHSPLRAPFHQLPHALVRIPCPSPRTVMAPAHNIRSHPRNPAHGHRPPSISTRAKR